MKHFNERGIDTEGVERVDGLTFHWKGRYHDNMQDRDTLETQLNVFEKFDPNLPERYRNSSFVFLGNIAPQIQLKVLDQVGDSVLTGMDTMNFWIESALDDLKAVLRRVDILFINDEEAFQLSGRDQVLTAAEAILGLGPKYVVIKRGEFGSLLFGHEMCLFVPAGLLPKVVDPTGAGDAFAGGFFGSIARSGEVTRSTLAQGMLYGTVMASYVVENFSVDGLLSHTDETINLRREFLESMTDYR
jgi:fructose-1-phosphate kinase PfkB-like protein